MGGGVCEEKSREMGGNSSSSGGFCYSENSPMIQPHMVSQIQGFVSEPEMFNLSSGVEMIGFSKNNNLHLQQQSNSGGMWKSLFGTKPGQHAPPPSKTMNQSCSTPFYHHEYNNNNNKQDFTSGISDETSSDNLMLGATHHDSSSSAPWQDNINVDDSSLRCVFPCEGNERPSQGLSLSLSSTNPSSIGLQSFELRQTAHPHQMLQDQCYLNPKPSNLYHHGHFFLRNSKFLLPAQDLLNEFCSLGTKQNEVTTKPKNKQWEEDNGSCSSSKKHPLSSLEFVELQKRKTKLLAMLEEVERRYKHYCNQMKGVVSSFEAVAGNGAARVYSALALKAMSRHFRCLKDGILGEIDKTRKAMGEKEPIAPGTTRGETPRLKIIDQALRQQRAFHQMTIMETHPWRPQRGLPERSVSLLRAWLFEHFLHPYPSDVDKHILARQTGLSRSQVSNWFINARVRLWKPMVEEMYLEEAKEKEKENMATEDVENPSPSSRGDEDQKPNQSGRLVRIDSECVSSIINQKEDPSKMNMNPHEQCFGSVEIDFSSYEQQSSNMNGGAVSLTLGLQQHGASGGVSLAFPSATGSMFYSREQIEDCQPLQYSLLDADGQTMPYRNLMGTHLLHHLPG